MRIGSGYLGGRSVPVPKARSTRPLSEKLRAAIFDAIGSVEGMIVLDAYAGSGAFGFEAISRGAAKVVAVEKSRTQAKHIAKTVKQLGVIPRHQLVVGDVARWAKLSEQDSFDIILADPPYNELVPMVISDIAAKLTDDGVLVLSHSGKVEPPQLESVHLVKTKVYGDSALSFYKKH